MQARPPKVPPRVARSWPDCRCCPESGVLLIARGYGVSHDLAGAIDASRLTEVPE